MRATSVCVKRRRRGCEEEGLFEETLRRRCPATCNHVACTISAVKSVVKSVVKSIVKSVSGGSAAAQLARVSPGECLVLEQVFRT